MGLRALISPTCKELAERLSSGRYERAAWPVRLAVRWHLWRCELCRVYAGQLARLGEAWRGSAAAEPPAGLKSRLAERLKRGS